MTTSERTEFDAEAAEEILKRACVAARVAPEGIDMLRFGDHAVFRIDGGRIVSRVGRSPDRLPSVRREVAVAAWLATEEYPAARLVTEAEQPVVVDGHPVTFWEGLADGDTYASTREMGELLRQLHDLEAPSVSLPSLSPFGKVAQRLEQAVIPDETRAYLVHSPRSWKPRTPDCRSCCRWGTCTETSTSAMFCVTRTAARRSSTWTALSLDRASGT
ncbi:phosphotransferase [Streptomyces sp. NPDC102360]|uniref:phosphotransferase n=1 Tax=Streptomyces sp. NPDC102360 TaxID=3366160 RepID=UPI00382CB58A